MRTQAQIDASRANGAISKGPVTEEGKAASSRNAIRHGLLSQTIVFKGESEDRWRQLSAWGLETAGISDEVERHIQDNPAFRAMKDLVGTSNLLNVLNRYDVRFDRAYSRALRDLKAHQKERITKRTQASTFLSE